MAGLAKQKFAASYQEFDSDPTNPECPHRQRSTYCHLMHHADASGLLVAPAYISADMPLALKKAIVAAMKKHFYHHWRLLKGEVQFSGKPLHVPLPTLLYAWLLPQSSATPSMVSHTHSASASGVAQV